MCHHYTVIRDGALVVKMQKKKNLSKKYSTQMCLFAIEFAFFSLEEWTKGFEKNKA
jgi:hypothetical protein